ncbi:MAG: nicotinate (nicotinamide) nucleotide adenylyltransferase [Ferrovum sp. 37-45-19]|jgi:nicotinate-nucleotide adenylyltransferase|uniref:nicotinate-nucleotide adenylyltransferase n=1 Tax=Ferrovum sp. JA12 TaxID=1356299 RepID=UPI0007027307|nr:nicotinate-nucleotide adenylyltransferase [Ferrovum sp. JA12]OYV80501.1 MAG: nicotinate (nicotinamide) nucleotide adenylyltransferase [Ferrovum sp. 21-44-67]OYV94816.1 MAG: nicotinate (nicotinamide) nucleotide adenylyltransferase [Ferrovum sp. 37-45-19]OZB34151.1 MAG: nicotinate (nicotinamide) nucleotide adenylyltransferase [Ferrovum sp. 34-44-207]HQT81057.1 nicotinate-nucleotide adenylyltransferase [Ferrovaceae bacterium]KRH79218.1 nicotinate-nucleotide adenylyltransferase [Ferrovum sp. JA
MWSLATGKSERVNGLKAQGYFGGTFDPIHNGHLSVANQLLVSLGLDTLWLMPAGTPWQREPQVNKDHRLAMIQLTLAQYPHFKVDEREIHRLGPTYTIDSLTEIRHEQGSQVPIWFIVGADSFINFPTWRNWQSLFDLAHIAIACRPQFDLKTETLSTPLRVALEERLENEPKTITSPAGKVSIIPIIESPISATTIRALIQRQEDVQSLVPSPVYTYISQHHLYQ